ncbi:MAG: acyl-CoA thioesterase [Clostridia bacterium]|nr:acyl-CoA thioesterase [Clostridia bacterium]
MASRKILPYRRTVQYYETDQMGIAHHANYLHWMEEARIDFMAQLGYPYADMEKRDILSPVTAIRCTYQRSCTFGDELALLLSVKAYNGVVLTMDYQIQKAASGETVAQAESDHVFLRRAGGFVRLRRDLPEFDACLRELMAEA